VKRKWLLWCHFGKAKALRTELVFVPGWHFKKERTNCWTASVRTLTHQDLSGMVEPAKGMCPSHHSP